MQKSARHETMSPESDLLHQERAWRLYVEQSLGEQQR